MSVGRALEDATGFCRAPRPLSGMQGRETSMAAMAATEAEAAGAEAVSEDANVARETAAVVVACEAVAAGAAGEPAATVAVVVTVEAGAVIVAVRVAGVAAARVIVVAAAAAAVEAEKERMAVVAVEATRIATPIIRVIGIAWEVSCGVASAMAGCGGGASLLLRATMQLAWTRSGGRDVVVVEADAAVEPCVAEAAGAPGVGVLCPAAWAACSRHPTSSCLNWA